MDLNPPDDTPTHAIATRKRPSQSLPGKLRFVSWVLNAIVTWDILEDTVQRLAEINAALEREHGQAFANNDAEWYGGPKQMEATFFGAAFNHVPPSDVVAAVANARWESPESVQLFLKDQEDDRWTLYEFSPQLSQALNSSGRGG